MNRIACSPSAQERVGQAIAWLAARPRAEQVLILGATPDAAAGLVRQVAIQTGAGFGWHRATLGRLAFDLAMPRLVELGLAPAGALPLEALCARVVDRLEREGRLGRLAAVADRPGLPRALARTLGELGLAGAKTVGEPEEIGRALEVFSDELDRAKLADRALVFRIAAELARGAGSAHPLLDLPLLLLDVPVRSTIERELLAAVAARAPEVLATVPTGDERTLRHLRALLDATPQAAAAVPGTALARVQAGLFAAATVPSSPAGDDVAILSAPGESRECVEIARRILREAERGSPFDKMAILLRSPGQYRSHLAEALGRARIPAYFEQGAVLPDPGGRAFLALLACAAEGLSARRFAEYLSLGEVPDAVDGTPPPAAPVGERWVPPDEEMIPAALVRPPSEEAQTSEVPIDPDSPTVAGSLRAPWRWEKLLVEAAVIGGRERWQRRLAGLESELRLDAGDDVVRERNQRTLADLASLSKYALPLLDDLAALPASATWGDWLERLSALATRALRHPDRVLAVLAGLQPMAGTGPVDLREVRLVLHPRLAELVVQPTGRRYGRILVAPIEAARGMVFDVVFVPGLAERLFPHKIAEDPLLLDALRARLELELDVREDRVAAERLALGIAVGAASQRLVLSYPRLDLEQSRPRVPSFYGLEVLRALEGRLPGFDELARRAEETGAARIGWPAPADRREAIDEAEHDLALLDDVLRRPRAETIGTARYLLSVNPHLARALRFRARRWIARWTRADGLVDPIPEARAALASHGLDARPFSATALETLAACPYRFLLRTIHRLEPREEPEAIEEIDPLQRGSLVHDLLFDLQAELRDAGALPVTPAGLDAARERLDGALDRVAARYHDDLHPAIERVWDDGIASVRADLREWLRRASEDRGWTPWRFELSFGQVHRREQDPDSRLEPVRLDCGIQLRGSIDLVERDGAGRLRATDYKTGVARVPAGSVIHGGRSLQPVLYALALEKVFPTVVQGGRLYYCTTRGGFAEAAIPLDAAAREAAQVLADVLREHLEKGFFPAAPDEGECGYCDFRRVCGPYEEQRVQRKRQDALVPLARLRSRP